MKTKGISYPVAKQRALKERDAWIEVFVCDPVTLPIAYVLANYTRAHPLHVTILAFALRLSAAIFFYYGWLIYAGIFAVAGFLFDGVDGKLARILQQDETLRGTVDFVLDQIGLMAMIIGFALYAARSGDTQLFLLLLLWTIASFIVMSLTSTLNRLRVEAGIKSMDEAVAEAKAIYATGITTLTAGLVRTMLAGLVKTYYRIEEKLARYRTYFYPTAIEAGALLFMLAPILGSTLGSDYAMHICAIIAILCFLPEMLRTTAEIGLLVSVAQARR